MIAVRDLTKMYGQTVAVDSVTFDVAAGSVVGFLGPNGAGKSTTLKILTCYLPPTSGSASVNGLDVFHDSIEVRRRLGYLPENVPLYPEMKVTEYLEFRARLRGIDRGERRLRIGDVLEKCWLSDVQRKSIGHLSKGYRQRVGLADAMLHNPPVLIMDEPTVGLDPAQILEMRKLIRELSGSHTVMLSTHILPEVEAVCQRVIIIASGRIVAQGTLDELRETQRSESRLVVECAGPAAEVKQAIARIDGVGRVSALSEGDGRHVAFAIEQMPGRDVREAIAREIVSRGWGLREIRTDRGSLEELFVRVTAGQAQKR